MYQPVVIMGMHRSGTGMLARILEDLGLFVGKEKERNHEAIFFLRINDWILNLCGGAWDNPEVVDSLLKNKELFEMVTSYLQKYLRSPRNQEFLDLNQTGGFNLFSMTIPWGWKDPRNTFTLPIWLTLFPEAKVLHIVRNGVDAAASLKTRGEEEMQASKSWAANANSYYLPRFVTSVSCLNLENGFKLWEKYVSKGVETLNTVNPINKMEIRYEDLVSDKGELLTSLCDFSGLKVSAVEIKAALTTINPHKAFAYQSNSSLLNFYDKVKNSPMMKQYYPDEFYRKGGTKAA